jgi:hypothetical protein
VAQSGRSEARLRSRAAVLRPLSLFDVAEDIAYGWKLVEEINEISKSKTLRYLARERGVSYADLIDDWMSWQASEPDEESAGYRIKQFIVDFCNKKQIPSQFYRAFGSWEYAG